MLAVSHSSALVSSKSVDTTSEGVTDTTLRYGRTGWEITVICKNDANVQKDIRKSGHLMLWVLLINSTPDTWCGRWDGSKPGPDWVSEPPARRRIVSVREDQGHNGNCCVPAAEKEWPTPVVGYTIARSHAPCHVCLLSWTFSDLLTFTLNSLSHCLQFTSSPCAPSLATYGGWGGSEAWAGVN